MDVNNWLALAVAILIAVRVLATHAGETMEELIDIAEKVRDKWWSFQEEKRKKKTPPPVEAALKPMPNPNHTHQHQKDDQEHEEQPAEPPHQAEENR